MKKKILLLIILSKMVMLCSIQAQNDKQTPQVTFYLAFEDAMGNKDTIYVGYDDNGTIELDSIFGENNIKNTPFDSLFEVRISDVFNHVEMGFCTSDLSDFGIFNIDPTSFHTKTQIIETPCSTHIWATKQIIPILIKAKFFPIKISWEDTNMFSLDSCLRYTLFNHMYYGFWWDIGIAYSNSLPPFFHDIFLINENGNLIIDSIPFYDDFLNYPPEHYIDINEDTVRLYYLALMPYNGAITLSISEKENARFLVFPNPSNDYIIIESKNYTGKSYDLEIYDVFGKLYFKDTFNEKSNKINIEHLKPGIYFIKINTVTDSLIKKVIKI